MSKDLERLWKILNERYGIHTLEELEKDIQKTELDIGMFTMPYERLERSEIKSEFIN